MKETKRTTSFTRRHVGHPRSGLKGCDFIVDLLFSPKGQRTLFRSLLYYCYRKVGQTLSPISGSQFRLLTFAFVTVTYMIRKSDHSVQVIKTEKGKRQNQETKLNLLLITADLSTAPYWTLLYCLISSFKTTRGVHLFIRTKIQGLHAPIRVFFFFIKRVIRCFPVLH